MDLNELKHIAAQVLFIANQCNIDLVPEKEQRMWNKNLDLARDFYKNPNTSSKGLVDFQLLWGSILSISRETPVLIPDDVSSERWDRVRENLKRAI